MRNMQAPVVVVGAGSAGMAAALAARQAGADVLLLEKGVPARSGSTVGAQQLCGVGAWSLPEDSVDLHFRDSVLGSRYLGDQGLLRILVAEAGERVQAVIDTGLRLDRRPDGRFALIPVAGHSQPRSLGHGDVTGRSLADLLRRECQRAGVVILGDVLVLRLIADGEQVTGLLAVDLNAGEVLQVAAAAVVLATGGAGQLYPLTTNPLQATGDGLALGLRAGALACDLEMYQFYPACLVTPPAIRGVAVGLSEYGTLRNSAGEQFMLRYDPEHGDRATRDVLSYGIYSEIRAGRGSPNGGIYLDVRGFPDEVYQQFAEEYKLCLENGLDLKTQMVEICPAAHYYMGGLRIDQEGRTTVRRLLACGEVCGGIHGANRLGNNSVADCLVMGHRAGLAAAALSRGPAPPTQPELAQTALAWLASLWERPESAENPYQIRHELQQLAWNNLGLVRDGVGIAAALVGVAELQDRAARVHPGSRTLVAHQQLAEFCAVESLLLVAEGLARSAAERTETRGAHVRADHPQPDANQLHHIAQTWQAGRFSRSTIAVDLCEMRPERR